MQGGPLARNLYKLILDVWHDAQEINVVCGAGNAVELRRDEAAAAMHMNFLAEAGIQLSEKRSPWLRGFFNARHTVVARQSDWSAGSSGPPQQDDLTLTRCAQPPASNRGTAF